MKNQTQIQRRDFLKIVAASGLAVGLGSTLLSKLIAERSVPSYSETRLLMGTWINLTLVSTDEKSMLAAADAVFSEMERLILVYDHRSEMGEVGQLNRDGRLAAPSQELVDVIDRANRVSELTAGAFDITIKPVLSAFQNDQSVTPEIKSLVDYRFVKTTNDRIWYEKEGVQITLDGIAKGAVIDAGVAELKSAGFSNVLVEAGGDLMAAGSNADGTPWRIGVRDPRASEQSLLTTLGLTNQAAATSGDYQFYFSEDMSKNHIINPTTFESPRELSSVTVLAPSALEADALSTAVMVMGAEAGLALIEGLAGFEALVMTKVQEMIKSSQFPRE